MFERKKSVLITGATGILGSWVVSEALARGYRPMVLMRESTISHARLRLNSLLAIANARCDRHDIDIVWGDVRKPMLGMDPRVGAPILDRIGAVIHCAACTSFDPKDDDTVWETNVHGVENVLEYLSGSDVPLYHVSTAYVAGGREGVVYESELDESYGFTNTYEGSKWQAERKVRAAFLKGDVWGAVFRPGIIVGASANGAISDFQNVYKFLRLVDLAMIESPIGSSTIRLECRPNTFSNIVPVDWTAKALWHIIEQEGPSCRTYHLTNPNHNTLEEVGRWAAAKLEAVRTKLEFVEELDGHLSPVESLAVKALRHYQHYTKNQPYFDNTNTRRVTLTRVPFPRIDHGFYDALFAYARNRRWKGAVHTLSNVVGHPSLPNSPGLVNSTAARAV